MQGEIKAAQLVLHHDSRQPVGFHSGRLLLVGDLDKSSLEIGRAHV